MPNLIVEVLVKNMGNDLGYVSTTNNWVNLLHVFLIFLGPLKYYILVNHYKF